MFGNAQKDFLTAAEMQVIAEAQRVTGELEAEADAYRRSRIAMRALRESEERARQLAREREIAAQASHLHGVRADSAVDTLYDVIHDFAKATGVDEEVLKQRYAVKRRSQYAKADIAKRLQSKDVAVDLTPQLMNSDWFDPEA